MEWIGYTTHHLWGNITILLMILLMLWFRRTSKRNDDSLKSVIITIVIVIGFVLALTYTKFLEESPEEVIRLF